MRNILRKKSVSYPDQGRKDPFTTVSFTLFDQEQVKLPLSLGAVYETHPAVHAVVNIVSRSLGQTGLKAYMTTPDGPRELRAGDRFNVLLRQPSLKFELARDLCVYGETIWLMVGDDYPQELVRLSPENVDVEGKGSLVNGYMLGQDTYKPADVLHIKIASVTEPLRGVSPLKALRTVLSEDIAANRHRLSSWSGATPGTYITRPLEAPDWSDQARARFEEALKNKGPDETAVLEEGMQPADARPPSAKDSEYLAGRKFVYEAVCSAFGVPAAVLAGTSSDRNAGEARRNLIQDAVAPLASLIEDGLNSQIAPAVHGGQAANGRIYAAFLIEEKLRGSFREQAQVFQMATAGEAWLKPDEVRAMLNLAPFGTETSTELVNLRDGR